VAFDHGSTSKTAREAVKEQEKQRKKNPEALHRDLRECITAAPKFTAADDCP
jgi:hypothetical protein